ncbi:cytosol aminopeptidase-like isoform X1 [Lycorma delicatula]|uniref:cytosol aminopeptidase-like isoform X1 n=1 Tax=Lycorma delicatula TaxID=130591 RepID=UPI003F518E8E
MYHIARRFLESKSFTNIVNTVKFFSADAPKPKKKGVVVGIYENLEFTKSGEKVDNESGGKLKELAQASNLKLGKTAVFHGLLNDYHAVALVGLGSKEAGFNEFETLNECKENIRIAAANGARKLQKIGINTIEVESFTNGEAAAEGSILAVWKFQDLKSEKYRSTRATIKPFDDQDKDGWEKGRQKAKAQNLARMLEQCPSNIMTPTHFAQCAIDKLCPCGVQVEARDHDWMTEHKMFTFLKMAHGSCEPPIMLELAYCGGNPDDKPVIMIGKGVTFDSGGLCLNRKCSSMIEYSADMAGAAVVVGVFKALCKLKVPINCNAILPLCENMPGGNAAMPGLVLTSLGGKTIRVDNTWHDGRIFLVDALSYAERYKPCLTINVATLDESMRVALAGGPSAVFTPSDLIWKDLEKAGADTGDRLWRFPLWYYYTRKITNEKGVDIVTVGKGKGGDPCTAAAFFKEFAPKTDFIHFDISGTGRISTGMYPYLRKKLMTGRPVRTIVEFLRRMATPDSKDPC